MARYGTNHSNQFIKGTRTELDLETRIKISATKAVQRLEKLIDNDEAPPMVHVAASKVVIDKAVPSLQAVQATIRSDTDTADENQLIARLQALIENNPQLADKLLGTKLVLTDKAA